MDVYVTGLKFDIEKSGCFLKGLMSNGNIYHGRARDDFHYKTRRFDDRIRIKNHITGNYTADFSFKLGKKFGFNSGFSIAPTLGYGVWLQKLKTSHGRLHSYASDRFGHMRHKSKGPRQDFRATWYSPKIGFDLGQKLCDSLDLFANYAFLFPLNYNAKAHYNKANE